MSGLPRPAQIVLGIVGLLVALGTALSEHGPLAVKPPFNSRFRSQTSGDRVQLRIDVGRTKAKLELIMKAPHETVFSAAWSPPSGDPMPAIAQEWADGKWQIRLAAGKDASFDWSPGTALVLFAKPACTPVVLDWTMYSDSNPSDSNSIRERAETLEKVSGLCACLSFLVGLVALIWPLFSPTAPEWRSDPTGLTMIRDVIGKIEIADSKERTQLVRKILMSVVIDNLAPGPAITKHAKDTALGKVDFLWAKGVFVDVFEKNIDDLDGTFSKCVDALGRAIQLKGKS